MGRRTIILILLVLALVIGLIGIVGGIGSAPFGDFIVGGQAAYTGITVLALAGILAAIP